MRAAVVEVLRVTVPVAAPAPSVSLIVVGVTANVSVGVLASVTETVVVPEVKPEVLAVKVTVLVPVTILLLTASMENVVEAESAGIVTVVGTFAWFVLLLDKLTVKAEAVEVLRDTVPVAAPAPAASLKLLGVTESMRVGTSASVTVAVADPAV